MKIRVSDGVKMFKEKAKTTWGLEEWDGKDTDVLFFGLYFQEDYDTYDSFKGNRTIFWCGSDILRTSQKKEWLDVVKRHSANHYCETQEEAENLKKIGINPVVIPSFLGNIKSYPVSFKPPEDGIWKIWLSGHEEREKEYGFEDAKEIAGMFNNVEIHFYGVNGKSSGNIIYHGFVSERQLDDDIKNYHSAIRGNLHDGVSEVIMKSVFLGQYPIARLPYEGVWQYNSVAELASYVAELRTMVNPNLITRTTWIKKINQYPWCYKNFYEEPNSN